MKYTDSKNNITFNNVKEAGVYHASGPIGLNGLYTTNGANITDINSNLSLINAIDINWNGAQVEPGVVLNTTGDLLKWIKEHSGNSQGTNELTINNQGYWCINGVSTGVKAQGEDGLTPFIGSNGNWWIGTTDTGVSTNVKTVAVSYLDSVGTTTPGRYTIGTLQIGNNAPITLSGINTVGEGGSGGVTPNISATASIDGGTGTPSVTVTKSGSNESPNFNFAFHNLKGERGISGSGEGGTGISEDDVLSWVASVGYALLADVDGAIATLTTEYTTAINDAKTWASTQFETKSNVSQAIANLTTEFNNYTLTEDLINYIKSQNVFSLKSDGDGSSIDLSAIYDALNEKLNKDDFEGTLTRSLAYLNLNSRLGLAETALGTKVSQSDYNSKISDLETSIAAAAAGVSQEELQRLINQAISGNYVSTSAFADFQSTLKGSEATIEANFKKLAIEALDESDGIAKVTAISNNAFSDYISEQNLVKASTLAEYAKTTYVDGKILELTTATSGLRSRIEALENGDFVSESELLSEIDDKIASITTLVTKTNNGDGTYSIESDVKISADLIVLEGTTFVDRLFSEGFNAKSGDYSTELSPGNIKLENENNNSSTTLDLDTDSIILYLSNKAVFNLDTLQLSVDVPQTNISSENAIYLSSDSISVNDGLINVTRDGTSINNNPINLYDSNLTLDNNSNLTVSGNITTNNLSLSPDGTNGTFLSPYGLYSVYNKSYAGSWGGEQLHIKLSLQTGNSDDSTVECAVNNIELLGNYVSVGNFDGGASGMIVRDSNVEFRSQTNIKFNNTITLAPAINGTEKIIANFLYNDNDLEIETPNGVCKISDLYSDSDETIKENITEVSSNILDIANARIVDFNFKGKSTIKFGSIAQDWKNIFPNAVKETTSGILCMDYGAIALGSAVTAAREIVALKEENQQLKDRLAAIEQKLEAINSALG